MPVTMLGGQSPTPSSVREGAGAVAIDGLAAEADASRVALDTLPADAWFTAQYHLANSTYGQRDLRLVDGKDSVWNDYTGAGVRVAVLDDGIDYLHPDLLPNYAFALEARGVDGYHPDRDGAHGTAVSGIIAAANNGSGTVGIAYDAAIFSMPGIPPSDLSGDGTHVGPTVGLSAAFANFANYDVINNSWGYVTAFYDSAQNLAQAGLHDTLNDAVTFGRGGLGSIIVKSAGNGRGSLDNTAGSWTTSHWGTIAVAAVERDGDVTTYSTEGAGLLVASFGGPVPGDVVTTDRTGHLGYNRGGASDLVTTGFNGTSAAAPMVSGIVALMLEANPDLGYRDVQAILAATARHTGGDTFDGGGLTGNERYAWDWNGATDWNGGAMHFSDDYGFGLVDALAAVRLAESWSRTSTEANRITIADVAADQASVAIVDQDTVEMTFQVTGEIDIERVALSLGLTHTWLSDLEIELESPDGTISELMRDNFGSADATDYGTQDMTLMSNAFRGEASAGTWTLRFTDDYLGDAGLVSNATITLSGRRGTDDVYIYTDEFSDYAGAAPARRMVTDTDGGRDAINAAAVRAASVIDLTAGAAGRIDGVAIRVDAGATIEDAFAGDGDDQLTGNGLGNLLSGGRGNDRLDGGAGSDTLVGGQGDDRFIVDGLGDLIVEEAGGGLDTVETHVNLTLPAHVERLVLRDAAWSGIGSADDNTLIGNGVDSRLMGKAGDDYMVGQAGRDTLDGGGGADTMIGGAGDDRYTVGNAGDIVREEAGEGWDTVRSFIDYALPENVERLELQGTARSGTGNGSVNTLIGNAVDNLLSGDAGNDYMRGEAGADTLNGGAGNDTMIGGGGNDLYIVGVRNDVTVEQAGEGYDAVLTYAGTTRLGDNIERLEFGGGARVGYGNDGRNTIIGNADANYLRGEGGADRLFGAGGRDTLIGGAGDDTLVGGAGADTFIMDEGADVAVIGTGDTGYGFKQRDMVTGFVRGEDLIDLSGVDGDTATMRSEDLTFVGQTRTPGTAEVSFLVYGAMTIVSINIDDDAAIEMQLQLNGVSSLGVSDFIL